MKRVFRIRRKGKVEPIPLSNLSAPEDLDGKLALIQALIPLGLLAVAEALKQEVAALAGERYSRTGGLPGVGRWSQVRSWAWGQTWGMGSQGMGSGHGVKSLFLTNRIAAFHYEVQDFKSLIKVKIKDLTLYP